MAGSWPRTQSCLWPCRGSCAKRPRCSLIQTSLLRTANPQGARRRAAALTAIIGDSLNDHLALANGTGAERWITPCDYLYVYNDRAHFEGDAFGWGLRKEMGFAWDELEGAAFRDYDPAFAPEMSFAVRCADHGETLACDAAVIASGVWSGPLAQKLGLDVPMESERGYHLELWEPTITPRAPVMIASGKFVITPMEGRLRLAGVVEFGGLNAPPSRAPFALLEKNLRAALPDLRWSRTTQWMGHRPAVADSTPLIGEIPHLKGAYVGFGHDHVGLTGGPKTGQLLANMLSGKRPNIDMSPYAPERYLSVKLRK